MFFHHLLVAACWFISGGIVGGITMTLIIRNNPDLVLAYVNKMREKGKVIVTAAGDIVKAVKA